MNLRPLPCQQNTGNRCARSHSPRSARTVDAEGKRSVDVKGNALFPHLLPMLSHHYSTPSSCGYATTGRWRRKHPVVPPGSPRPRPNATPLSWLSQQTRATRASNTVATVQAQPSPTSGCRSKSAVCCDNGARSALDSPTNGRRQGRSRLMDWPADCTDQTKREYLATSAHIGPRMRSLR